MLIDFGNILYNTNPTYQSFVKIKQVIYILLYQHLLYNTIIIIHKNMFMILAKPAKIHHLKANL